MNTKTLKEEARDEARRSVTRFNNLCHSELMPVAYEKTMDELVDSLINKVIEAKEREFLEIVKKTLKDSKPEVQMSGMVGEYAHKLLQTLKENKS